jgi:hypothetical protein
MGQAMNQLQATAFLIPVVRQFINGFNHCIMSKSSISSSHVSTETIERYIEAQKGL